jgi:hypothetical protein
MTGTLSFIWQAIMTEQDPFIQLQHDIEQLTNKNQLMPRLRAHFSAESQPLIHKLIGALGMPVDFAVEALVQIALHKRMTPASMIGILLKHNPDDGQWVADSLHVLIVTQLIKYDPSRNQLIVVHDIPAALQRELDCFQYPLPMVCEPNELKTNRDTGYILSRGSIILRDNHHEGDVCLDHLNRMNRIPLRINTHTAGMIANRWRNLDKPKEDEDLRDFHKRKKAFEKFDSTVRHVMKLLYQAGNRFYLTHKVDKRGRTYCQGYHVNYQGAPWNKAVVELADPEMVLA